MTVPSAEPLEPFFGAWAAFRAIPDLADIDLTLLTAAEHALYGRLGSDRRRCEWWAGRMAARGALRAVGAGAASVLRAPNGAPTLAGPHAHQAFVAITHGRRWAGAVATRVDGPTPHIGLDLVDTEDGPRVKQIAPRRFRARERALMAADPRAGVLAWAAREAAAKATRTGMFAYALSEVAVTAIDAPAGTLSLSEPGLEAAYAPAPDGGWLVFVRASPEALARAEAVAQARNAPTGG